MVTSEVGMCDGGGRGQGTMGRGALPTPNTAPLHCRENIVTHTHTNEAIHQHHQRCWAQRATQCAVNKRSLNFSIVVSTEACLGAKMGIFMQCQLATISWKLFNRQQSHQWMGDAGNKPCPLGGGVRHDTASYGADCSHNT